MKTARADVTRRNGQLDDTSAARACATTSGPSAATTGASRRVHRRRRGALFTATTTTPAESRRRRRIAQVPDDALNHARLVGSGDLANDLPRRIANGEPHVSRGGAEVVRERRAVGRILA